MASSLSELKKLILSEVEAGKVAKIEGDEFADAIRANIESYDQDVSAAVEKLCLENELESTKDFESGQLWFKKRKKKDAH